MGNILNNSTKQLINDLDKINATKKDISIDYDLTTIEGVTQANEELICCFKNKSTFIVSTIKTKLTSK